MLDLEIHPQCRTDNFHVGTLRGAATRLGIKAITVEIGNPQLLQVLLHIRSMLEQIEKKPVICRINSFNGPRLVS